MLLMASAKRDMQERKKEDRTDPVARAPTPKSANAPKDCSSGCLDCEKAHWYLSRPREAVTPQAHGTPTRAHRRIGLEAVCSHKSREDKTITLIVAKALELILSCYEERRTCPLNVCVKENSTHAH